MVYENKFEIGDFITVAGYSGRLFRIMSVKYINSYIYGIKQEAFTYRVIDTKTSEIFDVFEIDMSLYTKHIQTTKTVEKKKLSNAELKWQEYEDYIDLYETFGDEHYMDNAIRIYCELVTNKNE